MARDWQISEEQVAILLSEILSGQLLNDAVDALKMARLEDWMDKNPESRAGIERLLQDNEAIWAELNRRKEIRAGTAGAYQEFLQMIGKPQPKRILRPIFYLGAIAACLLGVVSVLLFLKYSKPSNNQVTLPPVATRDINPGGQHAILTLANGEKILLDSARSGAIANQGGISVVKGSDSTLTYVASAGSHRAPAMLNTLATPAGGEFRVILPDGTRAWLNAASSITYPTAFTGKTRDITIAGEVYLEVIHKSTQPFRVRVGDRTIEDIGTSFDINAYGDEPLVATTLVEGSIRIGNNLLHPGEQAQWNGAVTPAGKGEPGRIKIVKGADLEAVTAWWKGVFDFNWVGLPTIMRQISRWYNVPVEYQGAVPGDNFYAYMPRSLKVSKLLEVLEATGRVKFKIEDTKITVIGK